MNILDVNKSVNSHKRKKRVGRGNASGMGKTSGRGHKGIGQKSSKSMAKFEGGQMQIFRRIPKLGFNNINFRKYFAPVNLSDLERLFDAGATVEPSSIKEKGIAKNADNIKILGKGELTKSLTIKANAFSKSALEKIEKAGGKAEVI